MTNINPMLATRRDAAASFAGPTSGAVHLK
jgi:hypothetical protein